MVGSWVVLGIGTCARRLSGVAGAVSQCTSRKRTPNSPVGQNRKRCSSRHSEAGLTERLDVAGLWTLTRIERDGSIDVRCDSGRRRAEELAPSFGESLERVQVTTQTVTPLTYGIGSTTVLASVSPNRLTMRLTFSRLSVMNVDGRMRKPSWPSTANLLLSDAPPWTYSKLTVAWMA